MTDIPFAVTNPERIPAERYYDAEFYARECRDLWPHAWQMACRLEQVTQVGDWIEYSNLGQSVIVVRTNAGVRAYHNACRHRGVPLASGHGNCKREGFICPFHGWRWNIEGKNTFVYGRHMFSAAQLEESDLALKSCRTEQWGGCVFINFDDDAPSFVETVGPAAARLERYGFADMRAEWWYATILPSNWKIAMEAFMEGYHTMRTHPQLNNATPGMFATLYGRDPASGAPVDPGTPLKQMIADQIYLMGLLSEGMAGMCHAKDVASARTIADVDLPGDPQTAMTAWYGLLNDTVRDHGRARGEPTPDLNALAVSDPIRSVAFLFPHYFLLPFLSSASAYRVRPLGPESCLFELWSLTLVPDGDDTPPVMEPAMLPYDSKQFPPIPQQDYANIPLQQRGVHTQDFRFMRLGHAVEGLISNYQRVIDAYMRGEHGERLTAKTATIADSFDGAIAVFGAPALVKAEAGAEA